MRHTFICNNPNNLIACINEENKVAYACEPDFQFKTYDVEDIISLAVADDYIIFIDKHGHLYINGKRYFKEHDLHFRSVIVGWSFFMVILDNGDVCTCDININTNKVVVGKLKQLESIKNANIMTSGNVRIVCVTMEGNNVYLRDRYDAEYSYLSDDYTDYVFLYDWPVHIVDVISLYFDFSTYLLDDKGNVYTWCNKSAPTTKIKGLPKIIKISHAHSKIYAIDTHGQLWRIGRSKVHLEKYKNVFLYDWPVHIVDVISLYFDFSTYLLDDKGNVYTWCNKSAPTTKIKGLPKIIKISHAHSKIYAIDTHGQLWRIGRSKVHLEKYKNVVDISVGGKGLYIKLSNGDIYYHGKKKSVLDTTNKETGLLNMKKYSGTWKNALFK